MGSVFERHPALAYWPEPRHVWSWGNSYKPDDRLTGADARENVRRKIHAIFGRFVAEAGKSRLVEKTPSNCLRIPFLRAVFPDAKIILVVRDGRSVLRSTGEIQDKGVPTSRIVQRALETPWFEWPAYAGRAAMTITRKITRRPLTFWGPRPPGWREWVRQDHPDVVRAKQWSATILSAVEDGQRDDPERFMQFKYEDLMHSPREVMQRIVDFAELEGAGALVDHVAGSADPNRQGKWRDQLDSETIDRIRPHMEPTLNRLGYQW